MIEISDDSVAKIGRWPWDRDWHATLIHILTELGAKAIVFDVIFSEPSDSAKDAALAKAIQDSKKVYLAEIVEEGSKGKTLLTSLPGFREGAKGGGHINLDPDIDGVMRRVPLFMEFADHRVPQLSLAVALDLFKVSIDSLSVMGDKLVIPFQDGGTFKIPLDGRGKVLINWVGRWKDTFDHYSYLDVITSYLVAKKGETPHVPLEVFKDKICFIGTTAAGLFDIRPTPLEPSYPAIGVNLNILNNLLERRFIKPFHYWQNLLVLAAITLILFRIMKIQSYIRAAFLTVSLSISYLLVTAALFVYSDLWMNVVYPLALIIFTYFSVTLYNQLSVAIERAKLLKLATKDSLTGLFNIGHFKLLLKAEISTIQLRREKKLSIVMGDVDNFKKTNDTYGHVTGDTVLKEVAAAVKNSCRALDVAARYGGEEFILMLPGANVQEAFKVADKIRMAVNSKVFFHEKGDFQTSISIGVTRVSPEDNDIEALVARADRALYEAKHTGKNKVMIATDSPDLDADGKLIQKPSLPENQDPKSPLLAQ